MLRFHVNTSTTRRVTKRAILSQLAKIFDSLGLVAPITIIAKFLMQTMWRLELSWDESVPQHVFTEFNNFQVDIRSLGHLSIPQWISTRASDRNPRLLRCVRKGLWCLRVHAHDRAITSGDTKVRLLCFKSCVAPLKRVSFSRLELCGALLLI